MPTKSKKRATKKIVATAKALPKTLSLSKGQKWQTPTGHAEILHIGRTLVQYRFIKNGLMRGALEMKSIANFTEALKNHKATLIA